MKVEIVSKKTRSSRSRPGRVPGRCPTENVRNPPSSHYPSPHVSCAHMDAVVHDGSSRSITEPKEQRGSSDQMLPSKTSKYFTPVSRILPPTQTALECIAVLTPRRSPATTFPVCIESSDFEHPSPDTSSDKPMGDPVLSWPSLLEDDLMSMLRRLKPILVQETVRDNPWKLLVAVRLLNVTTGKAAIPVFCKIMSRWPTPQDLMHAPQDELVELLKPLGLYNKRAGWLKEMSGYFLEDASRSYSKTSATSLLSEGHDIPAVPHVHCSGVGPYAFDSLRIFCARDEGAWKFVMPRDKELVRYLRWRWAVEEGKAWYPGGIGVIGDVDVPYLITLVDELATHYDNTIGGEGTKYTVAVDYREP